MSIVRTRPWAELLTDLDRNDPGSPYLPLIRYISDSDFLGELYGNIFLSGFILSDSPEFQWGVHMLRVESIWSEQFRISYLRGRGGFQDEADKICTREEVVATTDLFLKIKFGVSLSVRKSNG